VRQRIVGVHSLFFRKKAATPKVEAKRDKENVHMYVHMYVYIYSCIG